MTWASAEAAGQAPPPIQAAGDAPPPQGQRAVFVADAAVGADLLDITEALQPIVELCCHRETQTPLTIGVVGPPGSGKSFALERLIAAAEGLAAAAAATPGGPFVSPLAIVSIDAAGVAGDPGSAIAAAVFAALGRERSGVNYAALADEAAHAGVDPYQAANKALERHDEARRRLDAERQARDDVEARRARLIENMLYETAGSRIDAYARARRGPIEARLRRFDLVVGDSSANFKDLVRDLAGAGWSARVGVVLGALWAYRSQRRLLLAGLALIAVGFGLAEAQGPRALDWLRGLGPPFVAMADGAAAHAGLISNIVAALVRARRHRARRQSLARAAVHRDAVSRRRAARLRRPRAPARSRRRLGAAELPHRRAHRRDGSGGETGRGGRKTRQRPRPGDAGARAEPAVHGIRRRRDRPPPALSSPPSAG